MGKFINGVGVHEGTHGLDDIEHDKQVAKDSGLKDKELRKEQEKTHEDKPNAQEREANKTYPAP